MAAGGAAGEAAEAVDAEGVAVEAVDAAEDVVAVDAENAWHCFKEPPSSWLNLDRIHLCSLIK